MIMTDKTKHATMMDIVLIRTVAVIITIIISDTIDAIATITMTQEVCLGQATMTAWTPM
jgi:hypothetical protein